jgi:hypothetical protein
VSKLKILAKSFITINETRKIRPLTKDIKVVKSFDFSRCKLKNKPCNRYNTDINFIAISINTLKVWTNILFAVKRVFKLKENTPQLTRNLIFLKVSYNLKHFLSKLKNVLFLVTRILNKDFITRT